MKPTDHLQHLAQIIKMAINARRWLIRSYNLCIEIGIKDTYSDEEFDDLEALSSRFSRASDILIQVYRSIDEVELESCGSVLDRLNRAEKRGLINSVYEMREIRELRNDISHEYELEGLIEIFHDIIKLTPRLIELLDRASQY